MLTPATPGGHRPPAPGQCRDQDQGALPRYQDPAYDRVIRDQAHDLLMTPAAPAWAFLDPQGIRDRPARTVTDRATRAGIDFALNLDLWLRNSRL